MPCYGWRVIEYGLKTWTPNTNRADSMQTTHQQVKSKIVERMGEWAEMFASNSELGVMEQAYMKLKSQSAYNAPKRCSDQRC